jgi:hypothetical protein
LRPQKLHVSWEAALPYELVSPLDNLKSWAGISVLNLTWTQRTPWQESVKRRFGIVDLARAMSYRDDIVLVANEGHRAVFAAFAKERLHVEVEYANDKSYGEKFAAGRFCQRISTTASQPADSATH